MKRKPTLRARGGRTAGPIAASIACLGLLACGEEPESLPVHVGGFVIDASTQMPVVGATIEAEGTGRAVTSDEAGRYDLVLAVGGVVWLRATGEDTIPVRRPIRVPPGDRLDFDLDILPTRFPPSVYAALGIPNQEPTLGIVAVHFNPRSMGGGEGAGIDRSFGSAFSFDAEGRPVLTERLTPGFYDGLIFSNVEPGPMNASTLPGTPCPAASFGVSHGDVVAGELTRIDYDCEIER